MRTYIMVYGARDKVSKSGKVCTCRELVAMAVSCRHCTCLCVYFRACGSTVQCSGNVAGTSGLYIQYTYIQYTYMYRKSDCLGCAVLLCLVCLFDLACFFLSSFSSLIYVYTYSTYRAVYRLIKKWVCCESIVGVLWVCCESIVGVLWVC